MGDAAGRVCWCGGGGGGEVLSVATGRGGGWRGGGGSAAGVASGVGSCRSRSRFGTCARLCVSRPRVEASRRQLWTARDRDWRPRPPPANGQRHSRNSHHTQASTHTQRHTRQRYGRRARLRRRVQLRGGGIRRSALRRPSAAAVGFSLGSTPDPTRDAVQATPRQAELTQAKSSAAAAAASITPEASARKRPRRARLSGDRHSSRLPRGLSSAHSRRRQQRREDRRATRALETAACASADSALDVSAPPCRPTPFLASPRRSCRGLATNRRPNLFLLFFQLFTGNVSSTKQSDESAQDTKLIPLHG